MQKPLRESSKKRMSSEHDGLRPNNSRTFIYVPCCIVVAVMFVRFCVALSFNNKKVNMQPEKISLSFYETYSPVDGLSQEHGLTDDDFVVAHRVSPWSYLNSKNTQEKQATITLNAILRPLLLHDVDAEADFTFEEASENQQSQHVAKLLKTDDGSGSSKANAAIVYLLNPKKCCVVDSVQLLFENFNRKYQYPVLIFHESDITATEIVEMLKPVLKENELKLISPQHVEFAMPPNMTLERFQEFRRSAEPPLDKLKSFKIGYSHMIRFFFKELFNNSEIKKLDYFWRLDTDSYVTSEVPFDVFQHMKEKGYKYGFMGSSFDPIKVTVGMPETFQNYLDSHKDVGERLTKNLHLWKNGTHLKGEYKTMTGVWPFRTSQPMIYNNFEIVEIRAFQDAGVQNFIDTVDATNNIYWLRWGDAVLRFFEMVGFLDVGKDVYRFDADFGYTHQTYKSLPQHLKNDSFYANFTIPSKRIKASESPIV